MFSTNFFSKVLPLLFLIPVIGTLTPSSAEAGSMNCYGSRSYQSCTYSDWVNGEYVTCYGTITEYSENWNCY